MKQFQFGESFALKKSITDDVLKAQLKTRLESMFKLSQFKDDGESVTVCGTSGGKKAWVRHGALSATVDVAIEDGKARFVITGEIKPATSLVVFYSLGLLTVLLIGLLPGSLNTSGENAGAADALVFLVIGAYIVYDIESKLREARRMIEEVIRALRAEFEQ